MIFIILGLIAASLSFVIARAITGPTGYDRILAANTFGTNVIIILCILAFAVDDMGYLDVAFVYGILNFVCTLTIARLRIFSNFKKGKK